MTDFKQILLLIMPLITLIVGATLGFYFNSINNQKNQKYQITNEVIKHFFTIRKELSDFLCLLANLDTGNVIEIKDIEKYILKLNMIYYKNYDFFPREVLLEINCLYACLKDKEANIYTIEDRKVKIIEGTELELFLDKLTIINGFKYAAIFNLNHKKYEIRKSASINFQARNVLIKLNKFFTIKNLSTIVNELHKKNY